MTTNGSNTKGTEKPEQEYRERYVDSANSFNTADEACETISNGAFSRWYNEKQYASNILNGTPYFNGPSKLREATRHSPSSLLQCKRKVTYDDLNAPEETENPDGIFWFGSRFEEDIVLPFLQDVIAGPKEYVTNSMWVDYTVETDEGDIQIKGATDPVIVDQRCEPLVLFEIKTKRSVEGLNTPDSHHRAQVHAYMKGLSEKYERNISDAIILYGGRTNLDIRAFSVEFDPWFWRETVVSWAETQTMYRINSELPPAEPEHDWECDFCAYQQRCGQGDREFVDVGPTGLLPRFTGYPRSKLVDYLSTYTDAALTPALASEFPGLAEEYSVLNWVCDACNTSFDRETIDWNGDVTAPPRCPKCSEGGVTVLLSAPKPTDQPAQEVEDNE